MSHVDHIDNLGHKEMKVLGHRVLLKMEILVHEEKRSAGGLILEAERKVYNEDSEVGVVMDIGDRAFKDIGEGISWVKLGDKVLIAKYTGLLIPGHKNLRIVNDEDLLVKYHK